MPAGPEPEPIAAPGFIAVADLARASAAPRARGRIRTEPEDFRVEELLGYELEGAGPHLWLNLAKRDRNTEEVAGLLAGLAQVRRGEVGYAGLKDRRAVTRQWFSIPVAENRSMDLAALDEVPGLEVVQVTRHRKKLRRRGFRANRFRIVVRGLSGEREGPAAAVARVRRDGVPNYFGEQRFGRDAGNVEQAWRMLGADRRPRTRHLRGIYLSSARSLLFNRVLDARVRAGTWNGLLDGDVLMLDGTRSHFRAEPGDEDLARRVAEQDLHPTGVLWGRGELPTRACASEAEMQALAGCEVWCRALERFGLEQERRALRVRVQDLEFDRPEPDTLELRFTLSPGSYATVVLREIVELDQP